MEELEWLEGLVEIHRNERLKQDVVCRYEYQTIPFYRWNAWRLESIQFVGKKVLCAIKPRVTLPLSKLGWD